MFGETANGGARGRVARFLAMLLMVLLAHSAAFAQSEESAPRPLLRVGYLRRETTGHPPVGRLEKLRAALLADADLKRELDAAGFAGIGLFACDGAADMERRLNAREFDLAFAPASIYAAHKAGYTAFLKARRPEDLLSPRGLVLRSGVVFASKRSPLFSADRTDKAAMRALLQKERLALVRTQSVAGFNAPLLALSVDYGIDAAEGGYLWFESSEEVAKAVVAGLADVGACERAALDKVLRDSGLESRRGEIVSVILSTDPVTTDPVVIRPSLSPKTSPLGRALSAAIIADFNGDVGAGEVSYRSSDDSEFASVVQLLKEFEQRVGDTGPRR